MKKLSEKPKPDQCREERQRERKNIQQEALIVAGMLICVATILYCVYQVILD